MRAPIILEEELTVKPKVFAAAVWKRMPIIFLVFFCLALNAQKKALTLADVGLTFFVVLFFAVIAALLGSGGWLSLGSFNCELKVVASVSRKKLSIKAARKYSFWFPLFTAPLARCSWSQRSEDSIIEVRVPMFPLFLSKPAISIQCGRTGDTRANWVRLLAAAGKNTQQVEPIQPS